MADDSLDTPVDSGSGVGSGTAPASPAPSAPSPDEGTPPSPLQALAGSASAMNSLPSMAPTDLPRFQRTLGGTLKGLALGLLSGGIPGAVVGAASPTGVQSRVSNAQHFQGAQAAAAVANARRDEVNAQALPQELQDQHQAAADAHVKSLTGLYGPPDAVFDNTPEAAQEAIQNASQNGGVPLTHFESANGKTYAWSASKAADNSNAIADINRYGILTGNPGYAKMTADQYNALPADQKAGIWHTAQQQIMPVTPDVKNPVNRATQIAEANRELSTVQSLDDNNPLKADLVAKIQGDVDRLNTADKAAKSAQAEEDQRKAGAAGATAGAQANAKLPAQQALEAQKDQAKASAAATKAAGGGELNAVAYDPSYQNPDGTKGANVVMNKADADAKGLTHYKADPSTLNTVVAGMNDVQNKLNQLAGVVNDPTRMSQVQPGLAAAMLTHGHGINLEMHGVGVDTSRMNENLYAEDVKSANQATKDYVTAMVAAHEAVTQLPRLQTFGKSNRMTEKQMEAAQNLLPHPGDGSMAAQKMRSLQGMIDPLRKQVPHMPGAETLPSWLESQQSSAPSIPAVMQAPTGQ